MRLKVDMRSRREFALFKAHETWKGPFPSFTTCSKCLYDEEWQDVLYDIMLVDRRMKATEDVHIVTFINKQFASAGNVT